MKRSLHFLLIVLLVSLQGRLFANSEINDLQTIKIDGIVKDGDSPLPGVNILVKGTTVGTVTDGDGRYSLEVPSSESILVFSFIGYLTEEERIDGRTIIDVVMAPDIATLAEVVVVGAVIKKGDLTGAVVGMDDKKLREVPTSSVLQSMTGRLSGVLIQNSSGVSGDASIQIRGNNTLQFGNNPIFVVDGVIMDGGFNLLNPNDIATIDVLKDASATALYGSRGANGVVIVTTKKGKKGEGRVTYDGWAGVQQFSKNMSLLGSQDIADLRVDAYANTYMDQNPTANRQNYINNILLNPDPTIGAFSDYELNSLTTGKSYNWLKQVTRTGAQQNHNVSFSKGTDEGSYFVSFNYVKNKGLMDNSSYDRYSGRVNLDQNIKKWLKIGTSTAFSRSHETLVEGSVFGNALGADPMLPYSDGDTLNYMQWAGNQQVGVYNPLRSLRIIGDRFQTRLISSNFMNIKFTNKINFRTSISTDIMDQKEFWYTPKDIGQSAQNSTFGKAQQRNDHWLNWQWDNTLTYDLLSGEHNLTALAGFSMQKNKWDYNQVDATGFATDDLGYHYINGAYVRDKFQLASDFQTSAIMSYLGRLNYSYNGKYFATVTTRYDGSSRFGEGHKWGLFPSVALSWNLTEENFFRDMNLQFIDLVKIRAGYGQVGNQNIPNFANKTLYNAQYTNNSVTYVSNGTLGNPNLQWERQKQVNVGIDLAVLNKKLNFSVDYFSTQNQNLLLRRGLAPTTGFNNVISNVGELQNKGIEITVNSTVIDNGNFKWTVSGNISSAINKVKKLYGDVTSIYNYGGYTGTDIQNEGNYFLGKSINSIYVYKFDKIAQQSDVGEIAGMDLGGRTVMPGDILPLDRNKDGIINNDDRYVVGRKDPKFYGGVSTDLSFKNFSINAVFTYNYGAKKISYTYLSLMGGSGTGPAHRDELKRWTPEHTDTNVPRAFYGGGRFGMGDTDLGVQNASYIRLSTLTLAYSVPNTMLSKVKLNNLRIYFTGSNVFIATKYKGYDPEFGDGYPPAKMFVAGVNIGL